MHYVMDVLVRCHHVVAGAVAECHLLALLVVVTTTSQDLADLSDFLYTSYIYGSMPCCC